MVEPAEDAEGTDGRDDAELLPLRAADADAPFRFSPAEWAALFPPPSADDRTMDRGAAARQAAPLTYSAALRILGAARAGALRSFFRLARLTLPVSAYHRLPWDAIQIPMWGLLWHFAPPTGRFSTGSLAAATAAFAADCVIWDWSVTGFRLFSLDGGGTSADPEGAQGEAGKDEELGKGQAPAAPEQTFDDHVLGGLFRWMLLTGLGTGATPDPSPPLVRHQPRDPLCPCPRPGCCGTYPRTDGILRSLSIALEVPIGLYVWPVARFWTLWVTLGSAFWATWWAAAFASVGLAIQVAVLTSNYLNLWFWHLNLVPIRLDLRLRRRAASLALDDLVSRCAASLHHRGDLPPSEPPGADLEYARLSRAFAAHVRARNRGAASLRTVVAVTLVADVFLVGIVCAAASGCIPLWGLASGAWQLAVLAHDLAQTALANREADAVADLYRTAASSLRDLLLSAPPASSPHDLDAQGRVRTHLAAIDAFVGDPGLTARFMGFAVSFSALRTLLFTALTVVVGLWGILRGLGVFVTLESACPVA